MKKNKMYIMRGLPGSGKTTRAKKIIRKNPGKVFRVNRDALRQMLWPEDCKYEWSLEFEDLVKNIQQSIVDEIHYQYSDVIVDDTNVADLDVNRLRGLHHNQFEIIEISLLNRRISTCIKRDIERGKKGGKTIGEEIIRRLAGRIER